MKNQDILQCFANTTEYVSGQTLADKLGVSRQAVWKGIEALRSRGYDIESIPRRGYRLVSFPSFLNVPAIRASLETKVIGSRLEVLDTVGSTNDYIKVLGSDGCQNGTVVVTREQTKGKGRLGRGWQSEKDEALAFSVLLRPRIAPHEAGAITPLAGLAVCKALREFTGLDCKIKWPNDIIVGRKKLCGILTEMSAEFDAVEFLVTGVGVNVDQAVFSENIAYKATSLLLETGRHFDPNQLLARLLRQMEEEFISNDLKLSPFAVEEYQSLCATVGRSVTFTRGSRRINGMAVGIADGGELKIMLSNGSLCNVNSGEVTVQGIY